MSAIAGQTELVRVTAIPRLSYDSGKLMQVDNLLRTMMERSASDLHLKPGRPPMLRVDGRIQPLETGDLKPEEIGQMLSSILQPHQKARLERDFSVDLGYGVPGLARFRCNIYLQRGTLAAAFRLVPYRIKDIAELDLPEVLFELCAMNQGLILVTGPTGSGKSTTLAAMIKHIVNSREVNVVTIEDPMEFLIADRHGTVSQREVGTDTPSFKEALRNSLRQDPDVIMVGEMRDPDTMSTAISAAETGHLVLSTLHTNSTVQTVDRILDSFPAAQQMQIRSQLAGVLRAVVSMKLVRRKDGSGRVAAMEVLRSSPRVVKAIEQAKTAEIADEIESSVAYHRMQTMNQSLLSLLVHGTITYEEAMKESTDPDDLSLKLRKMFPNIEKDQGGDMASPADFSEILQLQEFKRLYEEQDEKNRIVSAQRDEELEYLRSALAEREEESRSLQEHSQRGSGELEKLKGDYQRLKSEAQAKIDKLMERVRELNQKLSGR